LTDAVGSTTSFAYDQRGLLTSITDPLQKVTSLVYDVNGRPTSRTDRNGTALTYTNTPTGKLASITYPDQTQVTNTYDSLDRVTQMQDLLGTSSLSYDAAGRITGFTDPGGFTLSYTYDAAGNLTQITYPDMSTVTYAYDAANRLVTVTDWQDEQAIYTYDQAGRPSSFTQFNGITTTYTYDAASRLVGMASSVASYQFTLDGNGNRVNSTESQPLTCSPSSGGLTLFGYNAQKNRLLSVVSNEQVGYAYDFEGQLTSAGETSLTFDYNHRVIGIGATNQFAYDGRGNRLLATRAGVTTRYIYDPWGNLMAEADSNGITRKYIYGKGLLAVATSEGQYCYHFNGIGSTVAITDMNQDTVNSYAYDPFGALLGQQETVPQPFKYVGQYGVMAEPSGLYYMRARYYDPAVGRFVSEDPLGFGGGDVNLFGYAQNDPVNVIDPLGLAPPIPPYYPPGWTPDWRWAPGSKSARPDWNWWDPNGGEWHWDPDPNGSHPEFPNGHYDYHPWDQWNSRKNRCPPGEKVPEPPPIPWWQRIPSRWPGPFPIIILPPGGECIFNPAGCADPT
jgi:RHS repeat-associated protein